MGNIVLNDKLDITATKIDNEKIYELSELKFYVSKNYSENIYICFVDSVGNFDIIPLKYEEETLNHKIYTIDYINEIHIKSGLTKMFFCVFDSKLCRNKNSKTMMINVDVDKYNSSRYTCIVRRLNNIVAGYYDKIVKLTELNIDLYDKITKEVNKE